MIANEPRTRAPTRVRVSKYFHPTVRKCRQIESRAERDGIERTLTRDDIASVIQQPCHYCGVKPRWPKVVGIDRKDNDLGYVHGNCLPCCSMCNYMKRTYGYYAFLRKCRMIAQQHPHRTHNQCNQSVP